MPLPQINATIEDLQRQMMTGAKGAAKGSAGNLMPGANHQLAQLAGGGGTGGTMANPSRVGAPPHGAMQPFHTLGAPMQHSPVTSGAMPTSALGGASHNTLNAKGLGSPGKMRGIGKGAKSAMGKMGLGKGIRSGGMKNQGGMAGFGTAMGGGASFGEIGGGTVPNTGQNANGQMPLGMAKLPDEMF